MQHNLYLFQRLVKTTHEIARACERCRGGNGRMHCLSQQLRALSPERRGGTKDLAYAAASNAARIGERAESDGSPAEWWLAQAARSLALAWSVVFAHSNDDLRDALDLLDEAQNCLRQGKAEISLWNRTSKLR